MAYNPDQNAVITELEAQAKAIYENEAAYYSAIALRGYGGVDPAVYLAAKEAAEAAYAAAYIQRTEVFIAP